MPERLGQPRRVISFRGDGFESERFVGFVNSCGWVPECDRAPSLVRVLHSVHLKEC